MNFIALSVGSALLLTSISSFASVYEETGLEILDESPIVDEILDDLDLNFDEVPDLEDYFEPQLSMEEAAAISPGAKTQVEDTTAYLGGIGFAPAYFILGYNEEVFESADSVRIRGDGKLTANSARTASYLGLEAHWDLTWKYNTYEGTGVSKKRTGSKGHGFSPYVGIFDISQSINGFSVGALYSIWRGDENFENRTALNFGLGYFMHQDRYVLTKGIELNDVPVPELQQIDYTRKTDVDGFNIVISANIGF